MADFLALGPIGFRGPASALVPEHLTVVDARHPHRPADLARRRCRSNDARRRDPRPHRRGLLFITSANTSSNVSGQAEAAHCEMRAIRDEFGHRPEAVLIGHADEHANRRMYPYHLPCSTSIVAFHRGTLVLERHGSLGIERRAGGRRRHGLDLAIAPGAHERLPVRWPVGRRAARHVRGLRTRSPAQRCARGLERARARARRARRADHRRARARAWCSRTAACSARAAGSRRNGGTVRIGRGRADRRARACSSRVAGIDVGAGCDVGDWAVIADAEPTFDDAERRRRCSRCAPARGSGLHAVGALGRAAGGRARRGGRRPTRRGRRAGRRRPRRSGARRRPSRTAAPTPPPRPPAGRAARRRSAAARPCGRASAGRGRGSAGPTRRPPGTTSRRPPVAATMHGQPDAIASSATSPNGSYSDGTTHRSAIR